MTPEKQVSPAIRILRGERDASARATHLEAATRKFLVTTNERKHMSTTTNFKRIALVAVAALGLGVLSAVPSSAAVSGVTVTVTNGTSTLQTGTTGGKSDTSTAAVINLTGLVGSGDSITITAAAKSVPAGASRVALLGVLDTNTTSGWARTDIDDTTKMATSLTLTGSGAYVTDSETIATAAYTLAGGSAGYIGARMFLQLESGTGTTIAGTYTYTVTVKSVSYESAQSAYSSVVQTADVSIVVAALAANSLVASAANSTAYVGSAVDATADEAISAAAAVSTSNTPVGYITVSLRNASGSSGVAARESVTITTTIGQVGDSSNRGRSVVLKYNSDTNEDYNIWSDGTAGTGTITISTPSVTFSTKTVNFYAAAPKTLTTTVLNDTLKVGSNTAAIGVKAVDANGIAWTGSLYVYSGTVGVVSNDATECTYDSTDARHECSLTGVAAGTSSITVRDAATVATSTVSATAVTVTVSTGAPASFKLAFDKATYAPGEKATLIVTVVDSAGKPVAANTFANLFTSTGITLSTAAGNGSDAAFSTPAASVTTASLASSSALYTTTTPVKTYTVYMPTNGGKLEASATGGASLPLAGQVKVTATATITDNAAAALAAVTALATTVASLKTLITTLTNLVLKIQKKVKA